MIKKIVIAILSIGILYTGTVATKRLKYFERSFWVFRMDNPPSFIRDRFNRGRPNEQAEFRPTTGELHQDARDARAVPDSLRQRTNPQEQTESENGQLTEGRTRENPKDNHNIRRDSSGERNARAGRDFRRGSPVRLGNVGTFLAAFSLFTFITIFVDSIVRKHKKKKKQ